MFKFQNIAKVGDRIRAHDFHERLDCYVEGVVTAVDLTGEQHPEGAACFVVKVDVDGWPEREGGKFPKNEGHEVIRLDENTAVIRNIKGGRVGTTTYVPLEVAFMEWDGRIQKL